MFSNHGMVESRKKAKTTATKMLAMTILLSTKSIELKTYVAGEWMMCRKYYDM